MDIRIDPAYSKCRSAVTLLDAEGAAYTVRRRLEDVPSEDEIRANTVRGRTRHRASVFTARGTDHEHQVTRDSPTSNGREIGF